MHILDVCEPIPSSFWYILVIIKWSESYPIHDKSAHTVADILVHKNICKYGMPMVINATR